MSGHRLQVARVEYLPDAPARLVALHRDREAAVGRELLERLVCASKLNRGGRNDLAKAWKRLSLALDTDAKCEQLWGVIKYSYRQSRSPLSPAQRKADLQGIASLARALATKVDGDVDLDRPVHDYFDQESMFMNGIPEWRDLDSIDRASAANRLLPMWPALVDVLSELENAATRLADARDIKRRARRPTRRVDPAAYFAVKLTDYLRTTTGRPHHAAVVALTQAVFNRTLAHDFAKKAEENARRRI